MSCSFHGAGCPRAPTPGACGLPGALRATQTTQLSGAQKAQPPAAPKPGSAERPEARPAGAQRSPPSPRGGAVCTRPCPRPWGRQAECEGTRSGEHTPRPLGPGTHQLLLLSKKRTRKSRSPALVCMCSPTLSTSSGGAGIVTPLWWPGTRGIFGSMICRGSTCGSRLRPGASWAPT